MTSLPHTLSQLDQRLIFFPVRHHSPTCARLVKQLIEEQNPAVILIEGPADYNPQLHELQLNHLLPIAIYSYVQRPDGQRRGAFYPFCDYSPEWQALQTAFARHIPVQFIDAPWGAVAHAELAQHRYSDETWQQSQYVPLLCHKLGVDTLNDLWDLLFEVDPHLSLTEYLLRAHHFCAHLRATSAVPAADHYRELYMAHCIEQTLAEQPGRVLVITGGFHSAGLYELLQNPLEPLPEMAPPAEQGLALTPYTYERLDSLTGYEAGMPNPGFYHQAWLNQLQNRPHVHRQLLELVVTRLRERKQIVSTADLIAVETAAQTLANLRGHQRVWRQDLLDGIISALVKDEISQHLPHPFLQALYEVLRGNLRGRLAEGTTLPPLVHDLQRQLAQFNLLPQPQKREVKLPLHDPAGLAQSRLLHQIRVLGLPGFKRLGQGYLEEENNSLEEMWAIAWQPEFDSACIEAAVYGATAYEAAQARLLEQVQGLDGQNAAVAALLLLDFALIGLNPETEEIFKRLMTIVQQDSNFFTVAGALRHLLFLYRFDTVLGTARSAEVGQLLEVTFNRALWLLETLGVVTNQEQELIQGIRQLVETFERCGAGWNISRPEFVAVFGRLAHDPTQTAVARGAALGVCWNLGQTTLAEVLPILRYFQDPAHLGDFLTGLFALAREMVQRQAELLKMIDEFLMGYSTPQFLEALPALRLAFTTFTPREKHYLAQTIVGEGEPSTPLVALAVPVEQAAAHLAFEEALWQLLAKYGLEE